MDINGWVIAVTALILVLFGALLWISPAAYGYVLMEDSPIEWLDFYCLTAAAFAFFSAAHQGKRLRVGALVCVGLALFCLFVAGEEISWGQRLLGFLPRGVFAYKNVQREMTVHNLAIWWMRPRTIAMAFMAAYGVLFPLLHRVLRRFGISTPPWGTIPAFSAAMWLFALPITRNDDEVGELLFAVAMCAAGIHASGRHGSEGGRFLARFLGAFSLVAVLTSWASYQSPAERDHARDLRHLRAGQAFEGVGRPLEAARHYEKLARFWGSDWELWVRVIALYREAGDSRRAYDLAAELIRIHRREPRFYATLVELGDSLCIADDARERIREQYRAVLLEEPATPDDEEDRAFLIELVGSLDAVPGKTADH